MSLFTRACEKVVTLIAKPCRPLTEGELLKTVWWKWSRKFVQRKSKSFPNGRLAHNTVVQRVEDMSFDIKRQLETEGVVEYVCISTDVSDKAQFLLGAYFFDWSGQWNDCEWSATWPPEHERIRKLNTRNRFICFCLFHCRWHETSVE